MKLVWDLWVFCKVAHIDQKTVSCLNTLAVPCDFIVGLDNPQCILPFSFSLTPPYSPMIFFNIIKSCLICPLQTVKVYPL